MSVPPNLSLPGAKAFSSLEGMLGPLLIGTLLSTALWGVITAQTYDYFINPKEDNISQKSVVALLCILDTFDTAMNSHALYHYLVTNFANPYALASATWSASCRSLLNAISSFIVRTMFARRIYLVSRRNVTLTLWIMAISSADLVAGTLVTVKSFIGLNSGALPSLKHLIYLSFSFTIASDVSVTLALYWHLHSVKTGFRKTDSLVKVLMLYCVTTGLLVVIDATFGMIFYTVMPENLVFFVFYLLLGKLYISAYLASLNAREFLRKNQTDVAISLSRMSYQNGPAASTTLDDESFHRDNAMAITLETPIERRPDDLEAKNSSGSVS